MGRSYRRLPKLKLKRCFGVILPLVVAGVLHASIVNIQPNNNGIQQITASIASFATTGNTMGGMTATVSYEGGGTETVTWVNAGGSSGAATGTLGFNLVQTGDTFTNGWVLTNSSINAITQIILDGVGAGSGMTVFDRTLSSTGGTVGTPNSGTGADFAILGVGEVGGPYTVNITYSNILSLIGNPPCADGTGNTPCGDTYTRLTIDFVTAGPGSGNPFRQTGGTSAQFVFSQDTDNSTGVIGADVPEPLTCSLVALGLLTTVACSRRRKQAI